MKNTLNELKTDQFIENNLPCWQFALSLYQNDTVEKACLLLQDRRNINVNVLLYLIWMGHSGRGFVTEAKLMPVLEAILTWHNDITTPLRALRRSLKPYQHWPEINDIIQTILQDELFSEYVEVVTISQKLFAVSQVKKEEDALDDTLKSIANYWRILTVPMAQLDRSALFDIVNSTFPESQLTLDYLEHVLTEEIFN